MSPRTPDAPKSWSADVPARTVDKGGPSQKVFDWLFGYDYFIAHRSVDGKEYASALYDALTTKGNELDCFLDVKHYGAGGSLTTMQARALRKTTRLIVIVTTRAHDTDASYLRGEVAEFRQMHPQGIVVPIGTWETLTQEQYPHSQLLPHLPHLPDDICVLESAEQFGTGTPSPKTVGKLLNDFSEERRSSKRLRWIWRTVVLLLFLLVAAVGLGIYARKQQSSAEKAQASAEQALTRSFERTIGVAQDFTPSPDEREALWELSELEPANENVRRRVTDDWMPTPDSLQRALAHDARGLHAAIGLNAELEAYFASRANEAADRLANALENLNEPDSYSLATLGNALEALSARMNATDAARVAGRGASVLAEALENTPETDLFLLASWGDALTALAARMNPTDATKVAGRGASVLAKALENATETDPSSLASSGDALTALAARMNPTDAAKVAGRGAIVLAKTLNKNAPEADSDIFGRVGRALASLALTMTSNDAASAAVHVATALENPRERDSLRIASLGNALAALEARTNPNNAAAVAGRLATALQNPKETHPERVTGLGGALVALATPLNPAAAAAVAARLARALENAKKTDSIRMASMGDALAALAARMNASDAAKVAGPAATVLAYTLESTKDTDLYRQSRLGNALGALAARMNPADAAKVVGRGATVLVNRLENSKETDPLSLENLGATLAALSARMNPTDAAEVAGRAATVLATTVVDLAKLKENPNSNDSIVMARMGYALGALAARMNPTDAASVAGRIAMALDNRQGTDSETLASLGGVLAALAAKISAARQTQLFGLSNVLLREFSPPDEGTRVVRERETVATVSRLLNAKELVEVLKWPFCVGEARKLVLAELEEKAGRTFGGSIWKVVEQADSLGVASLDRAFLNAPAKRPSIEDAIKELQAMRAGGTDKP